MRIFLELVSRSARRPASPGGLSARYALRASLVSISAFLCAEKLTRRQRRRADKRRRKPERAEMLSVQPRVNLAGDLPGEARHGLQLLQRGAQESLRGAEVVQDLLFARRSHAGQLVEDGGGHDPSTHLAVVGVGEAVGLVADALQQVQLRRVPLQPHRLRAARLEDLLVALGERAQGDVRQLGAHLELLQNRDDRGELALAAVEQDQIRSGDELLVVGSQAFEAPPYHLGHARGVVRPFDGPDPEPPVLALRRTPALEHDHRGHRVSPHRIGDVVAFYTHRQARQRELLPQRVERRGDLVAPHLLERPLVLEADPRVADSHLQDAPLVPSQGPAHLDLCGAQIREVLGEGSKLLFVAGLHQYLAGEGGGVVVLRDERERHALGAGLAVVVQEERVAVHDLAVAHGEDLDARRLALSVGADRIKRVLRGDGRLLPIADVPEGGDLIPQLRRPLEVHRCSGLAHRRFALPDQAVHPPFEEGDDVGDDSVVLLLRDRPDARRDRAPDVVVQARYPAPAARLGSPALAKREGLVENVERRVDGAGARERTEVAVARIVGGARGEYPRVLIAQSNHDVRVALVVPERGVEARAVALYEVRLQDERLGLALGRYEIYPPDPLSKLRYLRAPVAGTGEVARHPAPDVFRLADVQHRASGVLEDVDAGGSRQVRAVGIPVI